MVFAFLTLWVRFWCRFLFQCGFTLFEPLIMIILLVWWDQVHRRAAPFWKSIDSVQQPQEPGRQELQFIEE